MAKQNGLGDQLFVGGVNVSGDINSLTAISGSQATLDVTGIDKSAHERIGGRRDGALSFVSYFNPTAGASFQTFKALPLTDVLMSYFRGSTLGGDAASMISKQPNFDPTRDDSGEFKFKVDAIGSGFGLEWGVQLTAGVRTDTTATNGTGVDTVASAAFGGQAYLHVFGVTGTSVTVKIQDSADNATFADVTGLTFTVATGQTAERLALVNTATIRRYVRAVTTGTFTNAQFAVSLVKNQTAGQVF